MRVPALLAFLVLTACGSQIYDAARPGEFRGSLLVMWVGPGDPGSGDGRFVYVPDPTSGQALTFERGVGTTGTAANIRTIAPDWMYTDGGSVPRAFQPFRGLNPWGYAPAYMVHDWLFAARKCLRDPSVTPTPEERKVAGVTFRETYEIMAEAIKTLERVHQVSGSDVQPSAITWAVSTGISRRIWEQRNACERLTPEHERQVQARLGIGPRSARGSVMVDRKRTIPARVVAQFDF